MASKRFSLKKAEKQLKTIYEKYKGMKGNVIPVLQEVQEALGYLPEEAVNWIADKLGEPRSGYFGVATFYSQFYLTPRGQNIITVCCGTACHVKGSEKILNGLRRELGLTGDEETTPDMKFTLEKVNCVGACSIAPVVLLNKKVHGKTVTNRMLRHVRAIGKEEAGDG